VQFLIRTDHYLTLIDRRRRLAAQPDSVIADDVNAHDWVLLRNPARRAGDPTHALFADQSHSFFNDIEVLLSPQ
jgi:hypothetical protein